MDNGKIVEEGNYFDLKQNPKSFFFNLTLKTDKIWNWSLV